MPVLLGNGEEGHALFRKREFGGASVTFFLQRHVQLTRIRLARNGRTRRPDIDCGYLPYFQADLPSL